MGTIGETKNMNVPLGVQMKGGSTAVKPDVPPEPQSAIIDIRNINLDTAFNFSVDENFKILGTSTLVDDWYRDVFPTWYMTYPGYQAWTQVRYVDSTQKAMDIVKELKDKKLLKVKNVKEFIDIVDIVRRRI